MLGCWDDLHQDDLSSSRLCNPRQVSAGWLQSRQYVGRWAGLAHCASQEGALYEIYADGNMGVNNRAV